MLKLHTPPGWGPRGNLARHLVGAWIWWRMEWTFPESAKKIDQRPKLAGKPIKFHSHLLILKGSSKGQPKWDNQSSFFAVFADFRFSWELQYFGGADHVAEIRRKP